MKTAQRTIAVTLIMCIVFFATFVFHTKVQPVSAMTVIDIFTSSGTWTAPMGVTSVDVECWGGGGAGGADDGAINRPGGGGGAYAQKTISVTPGNGYTVVIGAGGSPTASGSGNSGSGGDSYFHTTGTLLAKGGGGTINGGDDGGAGGSAASSVGDIKRDGGDGGDKAVDFGGGGGGGAGGPNGNGGNGGDGSGSTGGVGGSSGISGNEGEGGAGGNSQNNGTVGQIPGGGGGGRGHHPSSGFTSGAGARGECRVTYDTPPLPVEEGGTGADSFTEGSVPFISSSGVFSQNNTHFYWDEMNNRLGVGTSTPGSRLEVDGTITGVHYKGSGSTPDITEDACAGTGGSASIVGTDTNGEITLNTGAAPSSSEICVIITFAVPYTDAPRVIFSPANATAGLTAGIATVYAESTTSTFSLHSTLGLLGSTTYKWNYYVME